jgi:hypothetical protein
MLTDQVASPPAWTPGHRVQACRSSESAIAAEALMNNAGYVKTVVEMGWGGVKNGALLTLAAKEFDAFLTVDKNLPYQQNVANLPVAVIVLEAYSNENSAHCCHSFTTWSKHKAVCSPVLLYGLGHNSPAWEK